MRKLMFTNSMFCLFLRQPVQVFLWLRIRPSGTLFLNFSHIQFGPSKSVACWMLLQMIGLFQKKSTPPRRKARFFDPPPPIHLDFQNCLSPVQYRKWSPTTNDPETANDPQIGPQMILDRKWSPKLTANDPVKTWGMEWILWDWLQKRTDYKKRNLFLAPSK